MYIYICACIHVPTFIDTHTYIHSYTHTYIHTYIQKYIQIHIHIRLFVCASHTYIQTYIQIHTNIRLFVCACFHVCVLYVRKILLSACVTLYMHKYVNAHTYLVYFLNLLEFFHSLDSEMKKGRTRSPTHTVKERQYLICRIYTQSIAFPIYISSMYSKCTHMRTYPSCIANVHVCLYKRRRFLTRIMFVCLQVFLPQISRLYVFLCASFCLPLPCPPPAPAGLAPTATLQPK